MLPTVRDITDFVVSVLDSVDTVQFPADHVLAVLSPRLDSPGSVLQRTAWRTGDTRIVPRGFGATELGLMAEATRALRHEHPLMVANARGDLAPATAQTAAGGWQAWSRSPARAFLVDLCGWDQMVSVGLRGGPTDVAALAFARERRDYGDDDLLFLSTVQPMLQAVDRHVERMGAWARSAPAPTVDPLPAVRDTGLSGRELSVLVLLGQGLTAEAVARRLMCSVHTVHKHTTSVYRKLGARDRLSAVLEAQRRGLLPARGSPAAAAQRPGGNG